MMWWWDHPLGWMMLWPIVTIGLCVVMMMLMMHGGGMRMPRWRQDDGRLTPFDILKERFARGENR